MTQGQIQWVVSNAAPSTGFELLEHKGSGHPDSLADALAELLSRRYSALCLERYGTVLNHNFDKLAILGGRTDVRFGGGRFQSPIRVVLTGRAALGVGTDSMDLRDIFDETAREFLSARLRNVRGETDIATIYEVSQSQSPGFVRTGATSPGDRSRWFQPDSTADMQSRMKRSNDTAAGVAHWPPTDFEVLVGSLARHLSGVASISSSSCWGTDVKIMAAKAAEVVDITICVPQISSEVDGLEAYVSNLVDLNDVLSQVTESYPAEVHLNLNTGDDYARPELYLTLTGSAIESGDEGVVGRGNRLNGMISMTRPYSLEGVCGKNPLHHVGKLYNVVAMEMARSLHAEFGGPFEVYLVSRKGNPLEQPAVVAVRAPAVLTEADVKRVAGEALGRLGHISDLLISGGLDLGDPLGLAIGSPPDT